MINIKDIKPGCLAVSKDMGVFVVIQIIDFNEFPERPLNRTGDTDNSLFKCLYQNWYSLLRNKPPHKF